MFDIVTAKTRLNIVDATQDVAVQALLDAALSLAERYCNRGFLYKAERVRFYDSHFGSLPLPRYPIDTVTKLTGAGKHHVHKSTGLITIHRDAAWWSGGHEIVVEYAGGYKVLPGDLELALWEVFDNLWSRHIASPTAAAAATTGGAIKSISSDGARVEFDVSGGAVSSTPNALNFDSGLPFSAQSILDLYRREVA